jgi:cytochrome c biogenesis protein CcmG, thiol:disulfide interchange protein DsbE
MRRAVWAVVIAVPVVGLLAFGFGRNPDTINSPLIGKSAAAFTLRSLDGPRSISLAKLRGRPVIVNFWASWCADCKIEHQNLVAAWQRYAKDGVAFVGIDYEDSASGARAFMRELGGGWPVVSDPSQRTAVNYGVYGVPETFFIDRHGIVRYKTIGPVAWTDLETRIKRLVGRSA